MNGPALNPIVNDCQLPAQRATVPLRGQSPRHLWALGGATEVAPFPIKHDNEHHLML